MKKGDRVVCINDSGNHKTNLKKGREYILYNIEKSTCGCCLLVDVGLFVKPTVEHVYCGKCYEHIKNPLQYMRAERFRKVEEKVNFVKLEIEVEEPCLN